MSCFWSFGSVASFPVAICFPAWSFNSTLENFKITPSLKLNLISVGAAAVLSADGLADLSVGWASADVASKLAANSASMATEVLVRMGSILLQGEGLEALTANRTKRSEHYHQRHL